MKHYFDHKISLSAFIIILTIIYCGVFVSIELSSIPVSGFRSLMLYFLQWGIISFCSAGLISLISLSRIAFAILFPVFILFSSIIAYFSLSIGVGLTATSIEIALVNDVSMWLTMLNVNVILISLLSLCFGVFAAVIRWKYTKSSSPQLLSWGAVGIICTLAAFFSPQRLRSAVEARMPYAIFFSTADYLSNHHEIHEIRSTFADTPVEAASPSPDVILILGESLRSDHLPMNGYARNTMPILSQDSAVISFPHMYSEATHTYASVPRILTRADSMCPDRAYEEQSFITLFTKAGYKTAWFANQDLSKSYTYFAHEADTLVYGNSAKSLYTYSKWLDKDLLLPLKQWLGPTESVSPKMAVVHTIGSHWWYPSHYSYRPGNFKPEAQHKDIGGLKHDEIVNSYDNTILETDEFLNAVFRMIENRDVIVVYVSDHGEGLGEDGVYLHATDVEPLHYPACLIWYSALYAKNHPEKIEALRRNYLLEFSTDAIFHTMLDVADIKTPVLDKSQSLVR